MDFKELDDKYCEMKEILGESGLLEALYQSLGTDLVEDHLRYIDRMYETGVFKD